jgi:dipeptide transport system substrate-binding protein
MLTRIAAIGFAAALAAGAGAKADTLVVCTEGSPDFLNAALSTANTSFDVTEQTSDRLVGMEIGGSKLVPSLAESWDASEDGLTYTFKLRHGVKWQSNALFKPTREFNADDVVFTFNRMADKNSPFYAAGPAYPEFLALIDPAWKGIRKVDDYTVEIQLKQPYAPLANVLSMQPFSISSAEYGAALQKAGKLDQLDQMPIGTGPFQFVQYQKDAVVRFRANPDFWGKAAGSPRTAKVDNLVFTITPDASVRYAKLRANECQIARYPNPADLDSMRADKQLQVQEASIAATDYIQFRVDKKPMDDKRVREALTVAVDLDNLVKAVFQGTGTPTAAMVPSALWGHNASLKPRPYDPQRAKQLLTEAGYPDGFETDLWAIPVTRAYMPNGRRAAEMIQADWAKIGVKAKIVTYEWGEYLRRMRNGEANVGMLGGTWDYPDPSQMLLRWTCEARKPGGGNSAFWCSEAYDKAIEEANRITSQAERAKLYEQAQQVFYDEMPGMPFADVKAYVPLRNTVHGFKLHFLGGQPFGGVSLTQ